MTASPSPSAQRDERLQDILAVYLERLEAGQAESQQELRARHPEFAAELAEFFSAGDRLDGLAAPLRRAAEGDPTAAPLLDASGPVALGDFRLLREVGRGGMGVVYEAEQLSLRRRVALKVLPLAALADARQLQRFQNEARAAASLHHEHIVPVYAVGSERGVHYYAMQLIAGPSLAQVLAGAAGPTTAYPASPDLTADTAPTAKASTERAPRDAAYFRQVAQWGIQAAEALEHAHAMGIVHRDVKPANLMLDGAGKLWVTDFGLARLATDAGLTVSGDLLGTLRYMSPEQALAKHGLVDHRTDVYALAATLYELLTLRPALDGKDRQDLLRQIAFEEPQRPRKVNPAIPTELEVIVLKALAKNPAERYAAAQELADDLRSWLEDRPIRARRPPLRARLVRWTRRHRLLVTGVVVAVLVGLAVLAGSIGWVARDRAGRRAEIKRGIDAALEESHSWQRQRRLPEALSAAQRAVGLLPGADLDGGFAQRVRARLADLQWLEKLESVRLETLTAVKDGHYDWQAADEDYGQLFPEAGLDMEALSAEEIGKRLSRSTVAVELAAVLDFWAAIRWHIGGDDDPKRRLLLRATFALDQDPWRTRLRKMAAARDGQALVKIAASEETFRLPPATLSVLGGVLALDKRLVAQAQAFLREAQRRHPNDFWLNCDLWQFFRALQPPQREEALRFAAVAVALRPGSPAAHNCLGISFAQKGRAYEAIAEYREALRLKPDYPAPHNNLGVSLMQKGRLDEAIAEYRAALRLKKDFPEAHANLGIALRDKGRLDEAIAEWRAALRLKKDFALVYYEVGRALLEKGRLDEAIAELRQAIRLKKDGPLAHYNLGVALGRKGQLDEAIAELRQAIRLDKGYADAHYNLGFLLGCKGQVDEAIAELRQAIRLKKDYAEAHCTLGAALELKGQFAEALSYRRRGHELGSRNPRWTYPSAQWVRNCERLLELDKNLPAILNGHKEPADASERLELASICQRHKKRYAAATLLYQAAFTERPQLANDLHDQPRYNAACAAALAGCGQGKDADTLDARERARLRQQALAWLTADLSAYWQVLDRSAGKPNPVIAERMRHWLKDGDFAGVRGSEALAKLPATERSAWRALWVKVTETLARAQRAAPAKNQAEPK